jgi:hypothetical protein
LEHRFPVEFNLEEIHRLRSYAEIRETLSRERLVFENLQRWRVRISQRTHLLICPRASLYESGFVIGVELRCIQKVVRSTAV